MKFAHIADCHLGSWRDSRLSELGLEAFKEALDTSIDEEVDFILFSGDILDTSRPSIDILSPAVEKLREVDENGIDMYYVQGSHDYSPTGKTMLEILRAAGLIKNVVKGAQGPDGELRLKFTEVDEGVKLVGMPGRKGSLEGGFYGDLDRDHLEEEDGFKIFMFHSGIEEYRPEIFKHMDSIPLSLLPKGFDYYAGGHLHKRGIYEEEDYGTIAFPGYSFPPGPRELEAFGSGGFYVVNCDEGVEPEWQPIELCDILTLEFDAQNKTPEDVRTEIDEELEGREAEGTVLMLKIAGTLKEGRESEIGLREVSERLKEEGAITVKTNTNKLSTREYEEVSIEAGDREELEGRLTEEHADQFELGGRSKEEKIELTEDLFRVLSLEQGEDETNETYERKIQEDALETLELKEGLEETL